MNEFDRIVATAHEVGLQAVSDLGVSPMVITQHENPMDDKSPVKRQYFVEDGPCGFAWVNVKPGTSKFAKYLKAQNIARKDSYYGGVSIWVSDFNQSLQKKEAYARAYAQVLKSFGIEAYSDSRMD